MAVFRLVVLVAIAAQTQVNFLAYTTRLPQLVAKSAHLLDVDSARSLS